MLKTMFFRGLNSPVLADVFMRFSFIHWPEFAGANGQWRSEWFGTTPIVNRAVFTG
jgi:hypothetical protein